MILSRKAKKMGISVFLFLCDRFMRDPWDRMPSELVEIKANEGKVN